MNITCRSIFVVSLVPMALCIIPAWSQETRPKHALTSQPASSSTGKSRAVLTAEYSVAVRNGMVLYRKGRHAEAAVELEKALRLAVDIFGPAHLTTAQMMNNLAFQYSKIGQYAKAEPLFLRSLEIREAKLGKDHPDVATSLSNLGGLYNSMGQYTKAEPLFLRSLKIREAKLGKDHMHTRYSRQNLFQLYKSNGWRLYKQARHERAARSYEKALRLAVDIFGPAHLTTAQMMNNLAFQYSKMGQYAKAERLYLGSLEIREAKLGKDHPDVALTLNNLASLYDSMGEYAKAEPLFLRSLKIREAKLSKDHPDVATSLNDLASLYHSMGQYAKAERLYLRSLEIREAKLGKDHPPVASSLNNLASLYKSMGQYAKAEPLYLRSLKIREAKQGKDHLSVASSLNNLALLYQDMGQYAKAEPLYLRSLKIREAKLGKDHPDVATSLYNLALLYVSMGQHAKAELLLLRSLKIREAKLGKDHPVVATNLSVLALLYAFMGQHAKAEPLLLRSLKIREAKLGKDHPDVAIDLSNLASLYGHMGLYARAEPLLLRSLKIREAKLGKDHLDVATDLSNLASLYGHMGLYARAEPLLLRSLKIREAKLGKDHLGVARSLGDLVTLYGSIGLYAKAEPLLLRSLKIRKAKLDKDHPDILTDLSDLMWLLLKRGQYQYPMAEPLFLRSLEIKEAKLGKDHPDVARSLGDLASLYVRMGQHAKAEPLFLRSLKIFEIKLGKDHSEVASDLNDLASLYHSMGQYAKAERLYLRSLEIREAKLDKDHPDVGVALYNLSLLHAQRGDYEKAWPFVRRARKILIGARAQAGHSVLARLSFLEKIRYGDLPVCIALKMECEIDVLELMEQQRAIGLCELLGQAKAQAADTLGEVDKKRVLTTLARINALNATIQKLLQKGRPVDALREELRQAERQYDSVIGELGEKHQKFVAMETAHSVTSKQVVKSLALDDETAIVGWVWFSKWRWGYVIRRTGVEWVDMSKGFDRAAKHRLIERILGAARTPATSRLSSADLHRVYNESLAPLEMHLKGIGKLIVIAQDWPAYLPVEMLLAEKPSKDDGDVANWAWLDKKYRISYAPSVTTLDILCKQRAKRKTRQWKRPLFALADPPFSNEQLVRMKSEKDSPVGQLLVSVDPDKQSDSTLTRLLRFDAKAVPSRLPGTRREARMIAGLLGAKQSLLLLGPDASERKLFEASKTGKLKQCRYVHLATHGFADSDRPEFSGLALARVPADKDYDGVLQMREVFQLKLDADLVVLSACQTGLGKNLSGEGMLGLSTAFFFAGTPSLVMSVWNVSDAPTVLLMHRFYSNLKAGKTKASALREAKNWLRNLTRDDLKKLGQVDPTIAQLTRGFQVTTVPKGQRTDVKPFAHPHYWSGFILTGDPE